MGSLRGKALNKLRKSVANSLGISIEQLEKIVKPLEKVYALADHTRTILFMLGDGLVPSNAGEGYLARLMIRKSLRLAEELDLSLSLYDLIAIHEKILGFGFDVPMDTIQEILELEAERYAATILKGISMVERTMARKRRIEKQDLIEFYDSHGVPAELVLKIAAKKKVEVEMPKDFYAELALRHEKVERKGERLLVRYPKTEKLYYDSSILDFEARVIGVEEEFVILDRTAFYPESGGQASDTGYLFIDKIKTPVLDVVEENGVVFHRISGELREGITIKGAIDSERRLRHMRHHSATHILLYALRSVLGNQVWQAGARKEWDKARLDITHYKKPSDEEVREIEKIANKEVLANKPITWEWMDRIEAERKYGFRLYQGGVPAGKQIRVVRVGDDIQACGGTHCSSTGEIGIVKVLRVESIQDGVVRFEFAAGEAALEHIARKESYLDEASKTLRVEPSALPKTVKRFFEEWKDQKKEIERLIEEIAELKAQAIEQEAEEYGSIKIIAEIFDSADMHELIKLGSALAKRGCIGCLVTTKEGVKLVTFSGIARIDARDLIKEVGRNIKGGGGGRAELAQGAGQLAPTKDELIAIIFGFLRR
jgi:alanyl-tRNA synthetase